MTKRIRLTIEWDGACSEEDWARKLTDQVEQCDYSRVTRVVDAELLTNLGTTKKREIPGVKRSTPLGRAIARIVLGPETYLKRRAFAKRFLRCEQ